MEAAVRHIEWPTRFPFARVAALVVGGALTVGLVTAWTAIDLQKFATKCGLCSRLEVNGRPVAGMSTLEKFYWPEYESAAVRNLFPDHILPDLSFLKKDREPDPIPYRKVVVMGGKLATPETFGIGWKIDRWQMTNRQYEAVLRAFVFGGRTPLRVVRLPLILGAIIWLALLIAGSFWDINRRRDAAAGLHRRGTKMLTPEQFRMKALGVK